MSHKQIYKQCKIERPSEQGGVHYRVAWIPSIFAKVGKKISLKDETDQWKDGWIVKEVWGSMEYDDLELQRKAQKRWEHVLDQGIRES